MRVPTSGANRQTRLASWRLAPRCSPINEAAKVSNFLRHSSRRPLSLTHAMPAITEGTILVTGANGFVAGWIVKDLLERGFSVRATVRSLGKADKLKAVLAPTYGDRLQFVVVDDFTADGAFDEALKGVDGVVHTATPIRATTDDPDELILPAVRSITSILDAANKPGATVKRVVFVSSVSAIMDSGRTAPGVWTDKDWNETDVSEVKAKGRGASPFAKYQASKALAERAAWDAYTKAKEDGAGWDLVSLCPPWVFGHFLGDVQREELNFSVGSWYRTAVLEEPPLPHFANVNWTDVRDFAEATRLALTKPEAGGERFIISAGSSVWGQWVNAARNVLGKSGDPRSETPEVGQKLSGFDSQKSRDLLGVKYHSLEETTEYILDEFKKKGWA